MTNTEAARVLADLLKKPLYVEDRKLSPCERLALEKALKTLRKVQSCKGGK